MHTSAFHHLFMMTADILPHPWQLANQWKRSSSETIIKTVLFINKPDTIPHLLAVLSESQNLHRAANNRAHFLMRLLLKWQEHICWSVKGSHRQNGRLLWREIRALRVLFVRKLCLHYLFFFCLVWKSYELKSSEWDYHRWRQVSEGLAQANTSFVMVWKVDIYPHCFDIAVSFIINLVKLADLIHDSNIYFMQATWVSEIRCSGEPAKQSTNIYFSLSLFCR